MTTRLERYIAARIQEPTLGHKEASEAAGYASGAPQEAVEAYRFARVAREEPAAAEWIAVELADVERRAREMSKRAAGLRVKLRAAKVVSRF